MSENDGFYSQDGDHTVSQRENIDQTQGNTDGTYSDTIDHQEIPQNRNNTTQGQNDGLYSTEGSRPAVPSEEISNTAGPNDGTYADNPGAHTSVTGSTVTGGISAAQAAAIRANTAKIGITQSQADAIIANSSKVGITPFQVAAILVNSGKTGITTSQSDAITLNTAKIGITPAQASDILSNNAKTGISSAQAASILLNTAKNGYPDADKTKLSGIETGATSDQTKGDIESLGISYSSLTNRPTIFSGNYDDLSNRPTLFDKDYNSLTNTPTTISGSQASAISANTEKLTYPAIDKVKLAGIEAGADVNESSDWNSTTGTTQILNKPRTITAAEVTAIDDLSKSSVNIGYDEWDGTMYDAHILGSSTEIIFDGTYTSLTGKPTTITAGQASEITANTAKVTFPGHQNISGKQDNITAGTDLEFDGDTLNYTGTSGGESAVFGFRTIDDVLSLKTFEDGDTIDTIALEADGWYLFETVTTDTFLVDDSDRLIRRVG